MCLVASWVVALLLIGCGGNEKNTANEELVVCSYGGSFQEAQRKAFFEPFEKETGIKVIEAQWSGEYAKLKAMVETNNPSWDLVTAAEGSIVHRGIQEGILAPIDFTNLDTSLFLPAAHTPYSVGFDFYSTVISYNLLDYPAGTPHPESWADFWDIKKFPGDRCLRKDPRTTLEFALLADGVPMDSLYPLDLDRAFKSLDRIKDHVSVWWTSGHQPAQLLVDREVKLASAFNGRIWAAATTDSVPITVDWGQGALDLDTWIIPKGARNYEAAMALIRYTSRPEVQIRLTKYINYSPTVKAAYENLDSATQAVLPTSPKNLSRQFVFNGDWWSRNEAQVIEKWNQWLIQD